MPFTQLNLQTQSLLESTFISDMRIIINANTTILKNSVQDVFNSLEIDSVNKIIGVDNPLSSIYTSNLRLGNQMLFTDGTTTIGSLTKSAGKSILTLDRIVINAGGSINALGTATAIAATRIGVGVANLAAITTDGLTIASSSALNVEGSMTLSNSAAESSETVTLTLAAVSGQPTMYQCDVTLNKTSKKNIELVLNYPITAAAANALSSPIIVVNVYTHATTGPVKGQNFNFMIKSVKGSDGVEVSSTWQTNATVRIVGGHDATKDRIKINQQSAAATSVTALAGPYLRFNGPAAFYGGSGSLTVVDTTVPMRLVTATVAGLCTVVQ